MIGIELREVVDLWAATLLADASLAAFTQAEFSADPYVRVGLNEKVPIKESNAPFVQIVPLGSSQGLTEGQYNWSIGLDLGIVEGTFEDYQSNGRVEQKAFYLVDQYQQLAREALEGISEKNLVLDSWTIDFIYDYAPLMVCHVMAETRAHNTLGVLGVPLG